MRRFRMRPESTRYYLAQAARNLETANGRVGEAGRKRVRKNRYEQGKGVNWIRHMSYREDTLPVPCILYRQHGCVARRRFAVSLLSGLLWLIPGGQIFLYEICGLLGSISAVQHLRTCVPQIVLIVRIRVARQDLIRAAK